MKAGDLVDLRMFWLTVTKVRGGGVKPRKLTPFPGIDGILNKLVL